MKFSQIALRVEALRPECSSMEIAQLSVLAMHTSDSDSDMLSDEKLFGLLKDVSLRLKLNGDHHAAVKEELREMARTDPKEFQRDQIWTLVRAINVQDQLLQLYGGLEPLDAE